MFAAIFRAWRAISTFAAVLAFVACSQAQATEFKAITIKVGYGAGGNYDLSSRLMARHSGRFLPGNPDIIDVSRKAYVEMTRDPDFLADATKLGGLDINVTKGEETAARVAEELKADPAVFEAAGELVK